MASDVESPENPIRKRKRVAIRSNNIIFGSSVDLMNWKRQKLLEV